MKYHQRDIVEVSFLFPDGTFKPHPAIIVSNDELQEALPQKVQLQETNNLILKNNPKARKAFIGLDGEIHIPVVTAISKQ